MHRANHPHTKHYCESVWDVDPIEVCAGRLVGLAWFSPDCKHFSKAKGGNPVEKSIRSRHRLHGAATLSHQRLPQHLSGLICLRCAAKKHAKVHDFQNLGGIDMSSLQASDMTMPEEHTHIRQDCSNIFCCGYGKVGTYVMEDPDLHLIAKAIYAYLCAYGDTNFLGREQICYDLKINKNTYAKYMKQLVDSGYITVIQTRDEYNKFCQNTYEINLEL